MLSFRELQRESDSLISEGKEIEKKINIYENNIASLEKRIIAEESELRVAMLTDEDGNYLGDVDAIRNNLDSMRISLNSNRELLNEAYIELESNKDDKLNQIDKLVNYAMEEKSNVNILNDLQNKRFGNIASLHIDDVVNRINEVDKSRILLIESMNMSASSLSNIEVENNGVMNELYSPREVVKMDGINHFADERGKVFRVGDELVANNEYNLNGYKYKTDSKGRIISAEGKLRLKNKSRESIKDSMEQIGKGYQKTTDDRGHLIADVFDGDNGLGNLVPQDSHLNEVDVRALEMTLVKALKQHKEVYLKVEPVYSKKIGSKDRRPKYFVYTYTIDGETTVRRFRNE